MLTDRRKGKTSKKKAKTITRAEDNIESMRSWVRKIEQTTNSVSSRLSAVEKRLSGRKFGYSNDQIPNSILEGPIERIFADLKEGKKNKDMEEVSRILDSEFAVMQDELMAQQNEIVSVRKDIDGINVSLTEIKEEMKKTHMAEARFLKDIKDRLERIEQIAPPVMKLGNMEVPIEITGIIGGVLAFIIAILILVDQNWIFTSPWFLSIVGLIFIGSAVFKALKMR